MNNGFVPVRFTNVECPEQVIVRLDLSVIPFYDGISWAATPEDADLIREQAPNAVEGQEGQPLLPPREFVTDGETIDEA